MSKTIIGIQGGPGSYNEEASRTACAKHNLDCEVVYLYTTEGVLKSLNEGLIDRGVFAIQNSIGGIVHESIKAMGQYEYEVVDLFDIPVNHCLYILKGTNIENLTSIMSHPQAVAQCKETIKTQYPNVRTESGEGDMIDTATAAKALADGALPDTTGVLASKACADLYPNLEIADRGMQDRPDNVTSFLLVKKL